MSYLHQEDESEQSRDTGQVLRHLLIPLLPL